MKEIKLVCSLGPSSWNLDEMHKMIENGVNIFRINMSHSTIDEAKVKVANARIVAKEMGKEIQILIDNKGPEIRLGSFDKKTLFEKGDRVTFYCDARKCNKEFISVDYSNLYKDIEVGKLIVVDDKQVTFEVINIVGETIETICIIGGVLDSKKTVNVPGVFLNFDFLSPKDKEDALFACDIEADFLALSFVRRKEDLINIKEAIKNHNYKGLNLISKIEDSSAITNIEEIIKESDGIMIARGDLAVNIPFYEVPFEQKRIIKLNKLAGKFTIVATEMLASMESSFFPTRAETSDVYNAVIDGADAVMTSGETANGIHPSRVVKYMKDITTFAEKQL
ncbi:MAG: pyruvate kinase [Bacilli bacterium]